MATVFDYPHRMFPWRHCDGNMQNNLMAWYAWVACFADIPSGMVSVKRQFNEACAAGIVFG